MKRTTLISASLLMLNLSACILTDKQVGDDEAANEGSSDETPETGSESPETGDGDGEPNDPCTEPTAMEDPECDGVGLTCDNAPKQHNPDQLDQDRDTIGDVIDLCTLVPDQGNTADSDADGIGNSCDRCRYNFEHYNDPLAIADPRLWIRNVPSNIDVDQDGVGDVCDNCVVVANCQTYGPDNPAPHDADADAGDMQNCQVDSDLDGIGDACLDAQNQPLNGPSAAGPVGFENSDDFDQDGINNFEDACPRLSLDPRLLCESDADCSHGAVADGDCADTPANDGKRYCNHLDSDQDGVGDLCDTCPVKENPQQVTDNGMQLDDEDGDFIGQACETNQACYSQKDARRTGFYDASSAGLCCITTYPGDDVLHDPNGVPLRLECSSEDQEAGICRQVPLSAQSLPGVVELPPGCGGEATMLSLDDVGGNALALWTHACLLPPLDQDFDGIGDTCDLCPFAFDPFNEPYVDDQGALWDTVGKFCAGEYSPDMVPGAMCELD